MKERIIQRVIALAVAAVLTVALGLGLNFVGTRLTRSPLDRALAGVELLPDNTTDVAQLTIGVPGDTKLLTVNGQSVTAEEYLYWLGSMTSYYEMMYAYSGMEMDLTQEATPGVTWDEQLKEIAYQNTVMLALTPSLAKEYGVSLTDEEVRELVETHDSDVERAGGKEAYAQQLQAMGINDATAFRLDMNMSLFAKVQRAYLERAAATLTADEVAQYVEDNDILRSKHILLLTMDMSTGQPYDEETQAAQKAKAEELLAQLRADPSRFDALMNENSEDSGLADNPDGYLFSAGQMVSEFEEGTRALEYGEISELVESAYGYHIILRLDPDCDQVRQAAASSGFDDVAQGWVDNAQVVKSEAYEGISTAQYYEKLLEFQDSLTQPDLVDQSRAELEGANP